MGEKPAELRANSPQLMRSDQRKVLIQRQEIAYKASFGEPAFWHQNRIKAKVLAERLNRAAVDACYLAFIAYSP